MHRTIIPALVAAALTGAAAPALAAPGGSLGTLQKGAYVCFLPGDASGPARRIVETERFEIGASSTYSTAEGWGTYLLTGQKLVFSRGPKKGATYIRETRATLRKLDDEGRETDLRCTRWTRRG